MNKKIKTLFVPKKTPYDLKLNNALKKFHKKIFKQKKNLLLKKNCPACRSNLFKFFLEKDNFKHFQCSQCSLIFCNPRLNNKNTFGFYNCEANEIYNEKKFYDLNKWGASPDDKLNKQNFKILVNQFAKNEQTIYKKSILEIGCGKGFFLELCSQAGAICYGVELNQNNIKTARRKLPKAKIIPKDLARCNFRPHSFDIIYARDLIEHIADPSKFINKVNQILKPSGILFLDTHNIQALSHKLLKERHVCIFPFEHPVHWSKDSITYLLKKAGFAKIKINFRSLDLKPSLLLSNFTSPPFTYIYPPKISNITKCFFNILKISLRLTLIDELISIILQPLCNKLKLGSTMQVIAIKKKL